MRLADILTRLAKRSYDRLLHEPDRDRVLDPTSAPPKPLSTRAPFVAGILCLVIGLGGFGLFAALAPMSAAVIAPGLISTLSDRKKVQHPEGGRVREILVREGQTVRQGQLLFRLEPLQAEVGAGILDDQLAAVEAQEARLLAERDNRPAPIFTNVSALSPVVEAARRDQMRAFAERRVSLEGQVSILQSRIDQAANQARGLARERDAASAQLNLIEDELTGVRSLYERGLIPRPRLLALERERARLAGSIGRGDADIARTRDAAEGARREILQARQAFDEQVVKDLADTRQQLAELRGRSRAANDVLSRVQVRAPAAGVVQGLRISTLGEVIEPGAILLEIAPTNEALVINARVRPQDVDGLAPGLEAQLRFVGLPSGTTPVARARLETVSRDRLTDPMTGEPYFLARVALVGSALPRGVSDRLTAGMPVDVIVPTRSRTLLSYLLKPLDDAVASGLREN